MAITTSHSKTVVLVFVTALVMLFLGSTIGYEASRNTIVILTQ
jgi:uncharacterized membrane protein YqiK